MLKLSVRQRHAHQCVSFSQKRNLSRPCVLCIGYGNHLCRIRLKRLIRCMLSCWSLVSAFRVGPTIISRLSTILEDANLPLNLSQLLQRLEQHYHYLLEQIKGLEAQLKQRLNEDEVGQRLLTVPCVGTLTASTISTELGDGKHYASSRDFAAATGLAPRQYSTGGRTTLLGISKRGNKKIRTLLVQCARVFIQKLEHQKGKLADWVRELVCRKSNFVVTCALANKLARIARALTTRQQTFAA